MSKKLKVAGMCFAAFFSPPLKWNSVHASVLRVAVLRMSGPSKMALVGWWAGCKRGSLSCVQVLRVR